MLKRLKKAFTITELVIVIAVIAILAAVLIPTFSNVIKSANKSAALQQCNNALKDYLTSTSVDGESDATGIVFECDGYAYVYLASALQYIGETDDLPSMSSEGVFSNYDEDLNTIGLDGFSGYVSSAQTAGKNTIVLTRSGSATASDKVEIKYQDLKAVSADSEAEGVIAGKATETLYFYNIEVNDTKYAGYFTIEGSNSVLTLEGASYSRYAGVLPVSSTQEAIDISFETYLSSVTVTQGSTTIADGAKFNYTLDKRASGTAENDIAFKVTLNPASGFADSNLTWSSSNTNVATVKKAEDSADVVVTAKGAGTSVIKLSTSKFSYSFTLNVVNPTVTFANPTELGGVTFKEGQKGNDLTFEFSRASVGSAIPMKINVTSNKLDLDDAKYSSNNKEVVDFVGTDMIIKGNGEATITVDVNGIKATKIVIVEETNELEILEPTYDTEGTGTKSFADNTFTVTGAKAEETITLKVSESKKADKITWEIEDGKEAVATLSEDTLTIKGAGTVVLTAKNNGVEIGTLTVTIALAEATETTEPGA